MAPNAHSAHREGVSTEEVQPDPSPGRPRRALGGFGRAIVWAVGAALLLLAVAMFVGSSQRDWRPRPRDAARGWRRVEARGSPRRHRRAGPRQPSRARRSGGRHRKHGPGWGRARANAMQGSRRQRRRLRDRLRLARRLALLRRQGGLHRTHDRHRRRRRRRRAHPLERGGRPRRRAMDHHRPRRGRSPRRPLARRKGLPRSGHTRARPRRSPSSPRSSSGLRPTTTPAARASARCAACRAKRPSSFCPS